ncbi:uncharacterized protein M6B38_371570 [Iris pallida]|uniref:TFIIS N-terminal domain-containing protein n=1 Tax=Iris pallida TaxID=29817 RepID=A0AAX6GED7_IRIPA|nr:uncharacterized protein M6B38_371570 [Iris pallida]
MSSSSLDYWRKLFRSTSSDIFQVVENAIEVAASDRPEEFLLRRDQIAQKLFACRRLDRCLGCDRTRQPPPGDPGEEVEEDGGGGGGSGGRPDSNYSYDEAEALTEEIEEETQTLGEVLRIKRILDHHQDESDSVLFDSLRRLQLMALSVETFKATGIGNAVNGLRKHNHKEIRQLARTLIDGWKLLVDEWLNSAPAIPNNSPDSVTPSGLDEEEGLPSPPLDEVALFATQTTSIPLSEFFDGMDDDGNLRNEGVLDKKHENGRSLENQKPVRKQQQQQQYHSHSSVPEYKEHRRQEPAVRQLKPKLSEGSSGQSKPQGIVNTKLCNTGSGHERPGGLGSEQRGRSNLNSGVQKKNTASPHDKIKNSEVASVEAKLEVAKRKLQDSYQQVENAKKQRTIQVMELRDLPKQGHHQNSRLPSNMKHRSNIRNRASMRR